MLFLVYIAFVIAMGIIYFFGIFITAIFWIFINFLIKNEILKNNETLQNSNDEKLKWHLELANKRLEMKKKQIDSQKNNIFLYLQKIKINKDLKV